MTKTDQPLDFLWFIPTSGDGAYLGSDDLSRPSDPGYFRELATAVDRLGYSGVLIPTGVACEESFVLAGNLAAYTEKLKFLVAIRPGTASPAYYARLAATLDRVSHGRLLLNIVVGGSQQELAGDGIFLPHDERYDHAEEFFKVFNELIETGHSHLDGKYIQAHNASLVLPPVQTPRPPIYFGGSSDAGIDFSVGLVDKYLTWGEPPAQVAEKIAKVRAASHVKADLGDRPWILTDVAIDVSTVPHETIFAGPADKTVEYHEASGRAMIWWTSKPSGAFQIVQRRQSGWVNWGSNGENECPELPVGVDIKTAYGTFANRWEQIALQLETPPQVEI